MAKKDSLPKLRVEVTLDNCANGSQQRIAVEHLREFFAEVSSRTSARHEVVLVDSAQIFHEKTDVLNARSLPEDDARWPKSLTKLKEQMDKGNYEVLPVTEVEKRYYDTLRPLALEVAQADNPEYLQEHGIENVADLHVGHLQAIYSGHIANMLQDSPHRQSESFANYAKTRADCGEESMAHYLRARDASTKGEKVLNLFVSLDAGALEQVEQAGKNTDSPTSQVHVVHPRALDEMALALVDATKAAYPECADIPYGKQMTSHVDKVAQSRMETLLQR